MDVVLDAVYGEQLSTQFAEDPAEVRIEPLFESRNE
jgi:hypothetical protein